MPIPHGRLYSFSPADSSPAVISNYYQLIYKAKITEEEMAEEHITPTVQRDNDGKFIIQLPLSETPSDLGDRLIWLNLDFSMWQGD